MHVVTLAKGQNWSSAKDVTLSTTRHAQPDVSLAVHPDGRGYVAWLEEDAVWLARME